MQLPSSDAWAGLCAEDGEFRLAARHWNGALRLCVGDQTLQLVLRDGHPQAGEPEGAAGMVEYAGPATVWEQVLAPVPPRFHNDLQANLTQQAGLTVTGDRLAGAQYYAAIMRAVELLRPPAASSAPVVARAPGHLDQAVGRYVHLPLGGHDHRVYFEEAGEGIPVLLQHTAGCHGTQWRHLLEESSLTDRFRFIAYDLPFHGKSVPPVGVDWWSKPYALDGAFLRSVPLALADALELDRPVFMGCSVGGLLALDLAWRHADRFRAVISVEGALKIPGELSALEMLWHPQVSNEYKARAMEGLMAPASPLAYRKETSFVYASGWPPVFLGDLHYYLADYDLREHAREIDTSQCAVHILSGEYDYSGTSELGKAAHEAISGSTWREMTGCGHFPMSENPEQFLSYVRPILDRLATDP